jgi:hypothetical protein
MSKSPPTATISQYYLDAQFILCATGADKITKIVIDEKEAWTGTATDLSTISVAAPELFGGTSREGGVVGPVDIAFGGASQTPNSYLASVLGTLPAYRQVVQAILKQVCIGSNYYLKPWSFEVTRITNLGKGTTQWEPSYASPSTDLINAVHVLHECLTNTEWGLGYTDNSTNFNNATWLAAAQACYTEGLAFAWDWDRSSSIEDFIEDVKKHIQASVYRDRTTGQWNCKLLRKLSSTAGLVVLNSTNTREVKSLKRRTLKELTSQVLVKFISGTTYKADTYRVSNPSLAQRQGESVLTTIDYSGVVNQHVAQLLGNRDLQQLGIPVYSGTLVCNRVAETLYPGDPFVFDFPDEVPTQLIMRVKSINLGSLTKGEITIEFVEDFFAAADVVYTETPPTSWVSPISNPIAAPYRLLREAPYYEIALYKGDSFAQTVPDTDSFIVESAASPSNDSISAGLWSTTGSTFIRRTTLDFCFTALLAADVTRVSTSITMNTVRDIELLTTDSYIQIDEEYMAVTAIGSGVLTVLRGVLDTVPVTHTAGARLFGVGDFQVTDGITYVIGETVKTKLTPKTPKGELALGSATEDTVTLVGRMHLPYPPANITFDGAQWPTVCTEEILNLVWATRNRLSQTAGLFSYYYGDITAEPSLTYTVVLRNMDTSTDVYTNTGAGTSLAVNFTSLSPAPAMPVNMRLTAYATNANGNSYQSVVHLFQWNISENFTDLEGSLVTDSLGNTLSTT